MLTILEAIKATDENAEGDTIAKALGGKTIADAIAGTSDDTEPVEPEPADPEET